ncbi:hypothetical protein FJZ18_02965 [Candidatus Pacearchaeota archaeon]|nr:hypothetical protein [Candidatus Pacearchaeota archaeon]
MRVNAFPKNKLKTLRLIKFCKKIVHICKKTGLRPILYGSLALFVYTKNKGLIINDIDILVPEKSFEKLINMLKKERMKYKYSEKWHTLQIIKSDLIIECDSIEFWQEKTPQLKKLEIHGLKIDIVSKESLVSIYKKAHKKSKDKPEENFLKYKLLQENE